MKDVVLRLNKVILNIVKKIKDFVFVDIVKVMRNFVEHDGELSTCALAFYMLISFIPASLVIISILSFFYNTDDMGNYYLSQVKNQLPSINIDYITDVIDKIVYKKRYLAFIWVPFLFWWGSFIFDIFERILEKAFRIEEGRKYWKAKIRHFIIILGMGFFVLLLTIISNLIAIIKNSGIVNFIQENLHNFVFLSDLLLSISRIPFLLSFITALIINTLLIFIMYRFVPPKKVDKKSMFKGALFASLSYEVVKMLFSYYITEINDYSSIFGSLSTIVILMIWIWYTCFLFVIGAEMSWVIYERNERAKELDFS